MEVLYEIKSRQLLKAGKPLKQLIEGSPIYRFYSAESGYILPDHEAELISGVIVEMPAKYKGIIKSCIKREKSQYLKIQTYEIDSYQSQPLCLKVKNISPFPIEIEKGEPIGTLTVKLK